MRKRKDHGQTSRREFLEGTGVAIVAATAVPTLNAQTAGDGAPDGAPDPSVPRTRIRFTVNGKPRELEVEDRWTLAELLRDHLKLTGTKIGCDRGECGACTVLLDGKAGVLVQPARGLDGRPRHSDRRMARAGRTARSAAESFYRA